jgi:16S rRNA (guanine527-N7)-methyltransferase
MRPEGERPTKSHARLVGALGLTPAVTRRLTRYLDLLAAWSARVNLTGLRTPEARVRVLVESVLPARDLPEPGELVDVGSGNGSPGLVLAAVREDLAVTLLEPRLKRWVFLRQAVREMGLTATVLRERHDTYSGRPVRTLTLRALALPLGEIRPLVTPNGQILVFGRAVDEPPDCQARDIVGRDGAPVGRALRVPRETPTDTEEPEHSR